MVWFLCCLVRPWQHLVQIVYVDLSVGQLKDEPWPAQRFGVDHGLAGVERVLEVDSLIRCPGVFGAPDGGFVAGPAGIGLRSWVSAAAQMFGSAPFSLLRREPVSFGSAHGAFARVAAGIDAPRAAVRQPRGLGGSYYYFWRLALELRSGDALGWLLWDPFFRFSIIL